MYFTLKNGHLKISNTNGMLSLVALLLGFYFFMMPFDMFSLGKLGTPLKYISLLPILAALLERKKPKIILDRITCSLAALLFISMASILYTVSAEKSLVIIVTLTLNISMIIITGSMCRYNAFEVQFLKKALVAGGIFTMILTFVYSGFSSDHRLTLNFSSAAADQNYLNGFLLFCLSACMAQLVNKIRVRYFLGAAAILVFTLLTGSRGALLAFFVTVITAMYFGLRENRKKRMKVLFISFVMALLIILFHEDILALLPETVSRRFRLSYIAKHGTTGRIAIWTGFLKVYFSSNVFRLLFGYGAATTTVVNPISFLGNGMVAHNLWIEQLVTLGFVGLVILVWMQCSVMKEAVRQKDCMLVAAFAGFLAMSMSMSLVSYKPMWNCIIMILIIKNSDNSLNNRNIRANMNDASIADDIEYQMACNDDKFI